MRSGVRSRQPRQQSLNLIRWPTRGRRSPMPEHQLEFVDPVADDHHLNVFLYGPPKTGKTMGGASAPGPILYLNGDRPNAVVMAKRKYGDKLHIAKITGLET